MNVLASTNIQEPKIFHREYENDLGKSKPKSTSRVDQCVRVAHVALPFIALYKPLSQSLSIAVGSVRVMTSATYLMDALKSGEKAKVNYALLQTTIAVVALASEVFAHPVGMLITTGQDLIINANQLIKALKKGDYKTAAEVSAHIVNNSLHLALFFTGGLEILVASLSVQILLGLYNSSTEFKKGNYLEGCGHLLMSVIRTKELQLRLGVLRTKWEVESLLAKVKTHNETDSCTEITGSIQETLMNILIKYGNNPEGIPVLQYAVLMKDEVAVNLLLEQGASSKTINSKGLNCLYYAVKSGELKLVKLFVNLGLDINNCNTSDDLSPLNLAIQWHKNDIAKYLIEAGANLDHAFHCCLDLGNLEILKVLVSKGQQLNISGYSPGDNYYMQVLLNSLFNTHERNDVVDFDTIIDGKMGCAEYLSNLGIISAGNVLWKDRLVPLVGGTFPKALEFLLDKGYLSPNEYFLQPGTHILTWAMYNWNYSVDLVKILISKGSKTTSIDSNGNNVFHNIFGAGGWEDEQNFERFKSLMQLFKKNGADINLENYSHKTPLQRAKEYSAPGAVKNKIIEYMTSLGAI